MASNTQFPTEPNLLVSLFMPVFLQTINFYGINFVWQSFSSFIKIQLYKLQKGIDLYVSQAFKSCQQLAFFTCTPHVQNMYTTCIPNVHHMYASCTPYVHNMYTKCTPHVHSMYITCSPHLHHSYTTCSQNVLLKYTSCTPNVHLLHITCTPQVHHMYNTCLQHLFFFLPLLIKYKNL